jgi:hypothetical protein
MDQLEFARGGARSSRATSHRASRAPEWHQHGRWLLLLVAGVACEHEESPVTPTPANQGELGVGLGVAAADVTAVRIDIVGASDDCSAEPIASQTVELPPSETEADMQGAQRQSNAWFAVPPGDFRVCVTPLSDGMASARCQAAEEVAHIEPGETTEVRLVVQCRSAEDGILDAVISLNEAPRVSQLTLDPGDVIAACESVTLSASADDADGDAITYIWSVGDPLRLRPYEGTLEAVGAEATFSATIAGTYRVNLVADDGRGGSTEVNIPIQVVEGSCPRD